MDIKEHTALETLANKFNEAFKDAKVAQNNIIFNDHASKLIKHQTDAFWVISGLNRIANENQKCDSPLPH